MNNDGICSTRQLVENAGTKKARLSSALFSLHRRYQADAAACSFVHFSMRLAISSGATSSTCVDTVHT